MKDYICLVTGGGTGIGLAIATQFASAGASKIILTGRRNEKLSAAVKSIQTVYPGTEVIPLTCDVADSESRNALKTRVFDLIDQLHVLVNNAGYFDSAPISQTTDEMWEHTLAVNLTGPMALTRGFLPLIERAGGSVLNIGSTLGVKPIPDAVAYNSSKAGLQQMTKSLALELGKTGVRVNGILPAVVETDMYRNRFPEPKEYEQVIEHMKGMHPLGRVGQPSDIANAAEFLSSPKASWITGVLLPVDGGMLCT